MAHAVHISTSTADPKMQTENTVSVFRTILVVDDELVVLSVAQAMLSRHGYTVLTAHDGNEALHLLEVWPEMRIDIALIDINLPMLDGFELTERLRKLRPALPVIYISAYAENERLRPERTRGIPMISKPFTSKKLLAKIDEMLVEGAAGASASQTGNVGGN